MATWQRIPAKAGDARDMSLIPALGRSLGVGYGNPLQYSCLENSLDRFFCLRERPYLSLVNEDWFLLQWAHFFFFFFAQKILLILPKSVPIHTTLVLFKHATKFQNEALSWMITHDINSYLLLVINYCQDNFSYF